MLVSNLKFGGFTSVQYSRDGVLVLSGGQDEWILWEARTGRILYRYHAAGKLSNTCFSSEDHFIVADEESGDHQTHLKRWETLSRVLLNDLSQDSLRGKAAYKSVVGLYYNEKGHQFFWADDESASVYNEQKKAFTLSTAINGTFHYFLNAYFSADKEYLVSTDYESIDHGTSTILVADLSDQQAFYPLVIKDAVDNLLFNDFDHRFYLTLKSGFLESMDIDGQHPVKIPLPGYSPSFTKITYGKNKDDLFISYSNVLAKLDTRTNAIRIVLGEDVHNSQTKVISPADDKTCLTWYSEEINIYKKIDTVWRKAYAFGGGGVEGSGQFSCLGNNRIFIHSNYVLGTAGFFLDLNTFNVFNCDIKDQQNTIIESYGLPAEKKEIVATLKTEGSYPNIKNHYYLDEFDVKGNMTDSIDVSGILPNINAITFFKFYLTPDQKDIVILDTSFQSYTFINRKTKKVDQTVVVPSTRQNSFGGVEHPLLFGPKPGQVIYGINKLEWFDLNNRQLIKELDKTAPYLAYNFVVFDHDSTSVVYKDNRVYRLNLNTQIKDTLKDISAVNVTRPIVLGHTSVWLLGMANGTLQLRDRSLKQVIREVQPHTGKITGMYFDAVKQQIWTIGEDRQIVLTDAGSFRVLLHILMEKNGDRPGLFAYDPAGEYFYPAFSNDLMHLAEADKTFDFSSFDKVNNRPDKIAAIVSSDSTYIRQLRDAYEVRKQKLGITDAKINRQILPRFTILDADTIPAIKTGGSQTFHIQIPIQEAKITRINILINGVPVNGLDGLGAPAGGNELAVAETLGNGMNHFQFFVTDDKANTSFKQDLDIEYRPVQRPRKKIYFIGIGVSAYKDPDLVLPFSVKDISDVDSTFQNQFSARTYASHLFLDSAFNRASLAKIKEILEEAGPEDLILFYYSGHGTRAKDNGFLFCPYNINFADPANHAAIGLNEILACFDQCKSRKRLMVLDACQSGDYVATAGGSNNISALTQKHKNKQSEFNQSSFLDFYNSYFSDLSNDYGVQIISSAYGSAEAYQDYGFKNSVFTHSFLNVLTNFAAIKREKMLASFKVSDLRYYLRDEVMRVSHDRQVPGTVSFISKNDWEITPLINY